MAAIHPPSWEKPIEGWSAADLKRILSDSPWARSATAHVRGYAKTSENFRPNDSWPSSESLRVTVRLESALPVQQALIKAGIEPAEGDAPDRTCIAVIQFPGPWTRYSAVAGDWRDARAWLDPAGASPISASEVRLVKRNGGASALVFVLPADGDLASSRMLRLPFFKRNLRTFDFRAEIGFLEIERRFSTAAMTFHGRTEF
jgi:hypothetical protein